MVFSPALEYRQKELCSCFWSDPGAELLGETYDVVSALALSGLLILAEQPLQLFQCGFQLSFLSVGAVALGYPALQKRLGWG